MIRIRRDGDATKVQTGVARRENQAARRARGAPGAAAKSRLVACVGTPGGELQALHAAALPFSSASRSRKRFGKRRALVPSAARGARGEKVRMKGCARVAERPIASPLTPALIWRENCQAVCCEGARSLSALRRLCRFAWRGCAAASRSAWRALINCAVAKRVALRAGLPRRRDGASLRLGHEPLTTLYPVGALAGP